MGKDQHGNATHTTVEPRSRNSRNGPPCYTANVSGDVKWIVGTGAGIIGTIIGTGLVLAGLTSAQLASVSTQVNTRIDDMIARSTAEHAEIRTEIRRLDDRLRAVELAVKPDPPAE